ncbi:MAG: hypothetical protein ACREJC_11395, partial [Tepidisphaeraceae bacterium]
IRYSLVILPAWLRFATQHAPLSTVSSMSRFEIAPHPWNDWYHVMAHTYGTWLPGDPRGSP